MALIKYDGYDDCIIGMADVYDHQGCSYEKYVYDGDKIAEVLINRDGMDLEGAMEFIDYNLNIGPDTPIVVWADYDSMEYEDD